MIENRIPQRKICFQGKECGRSKKQTPQREEKIHLPSPQNTALKLEHKEMRESQRKGCSNSGVRWQRQDTDISDTNGRQKTLVQNSDVTNEEPLGSSPKLGCEGRKKKELFQETPDSWGQTEEDNVSQR